VASDSADVALTAYSSIVAAVEEGAPVIAIGSMMDQYASNIVISQEAAEAAGVTPDSPPEEKIRALKGLKLAITSPGSGTDQLFHYLFEQVGMNADDDAELLPIGESSATLAAFRSGRIDGFSLSSPTSDQAAAEGGVMLFDLSSGEYEPLNPFLYIVAVANSRTLEDKARVLTCFSNAINSSLELIHEDPEAAKDAGRAAFEDIDQELYDQAFERNVAAYPETFVIDDAQAEDVIDFVADFEGGLEEASVETTVNSNFAESAQ
jgi:NitT/TauT family transport system substrate-binding protein